MSAVVPAARGGIGGRKLQAAIIAVVVLAATATSVVALGLLANAHGPFDRAFARQHGADVTAAVAPSAATPAQITATTRLPGVTAAAGPYAGVLVTARVTVSGVPGSSSHSLRLVGRLSPGGPVDDLTLDEGHWPAGDGQIVLARGPGVLTGSTVTAGSQKLTVVGIADSVTGTADGWVLPSEVAALAGRANPAQAQMLYRFASAGSTSAITADIAELRAALPRGALANNPVSYLGVRQTEESTVAPWVPFIIAFGVIALVISVLIVVNVISGAVTAGTTRIGVLKSIGFTPAQVVASYVLLVATPALAGCVAGAAAGNLLAIPLLQANAQVYQVGTLSVPYWVDVAVPLAALVLTVAGAVPSALRAGRMSAIQAIASGRAPRSSHGYLAHRMLARINSLPRAVTLGLAAPFARPARTMMTVVAILFGAAAVTFGAGLATSLDRVVLDNPNTALPVSVSLSQPGPGQPSMTAAQQHSVVSVLAAQRGTLHYLTETDDQVRLPGLSDPASVTGYGGNPAWSGYVLISGRWYSSSPGAAEVDVNTLFLTETGTSVGSVYTLGAGGHRVTVRIAGEVFDPGKKLDMYMSRGTLAAIDPSITGPQQYDIAVQPGSSARAYANSVSAALGRSYQAFTSGSKTLTAVLALVAMLTVLIIVVAGLGVLNTVALQIRERAHDIGVFKSVGMTPLQTLAMIVCSVAFLGFIAGIAAIPAGVYLHHSVVPVMAHAANSGYPSSLVSVYAGWELVLLALAGLAVAVAGALGPAGGQPGPAPPSPSAPSKASDGAGEFALKRLASRRYTRYYVQHDTDRTDAVSVRHALLALLSEGPKYGLQLREEFEARTGEVWPLNVGQVYQTLQRLERDGLVESGDEGDEGPQKGYQITADGTAELARWLRTPPDLASPPRDELVMKVLVALRVPGTDIGEVIQAHRRYLVQLMQQWTRIKESEADTDLGLGLVVDAELFRLDAVVRWLDTADGRLKRAAVSPPPQPAPGPLPRLRRRVGPAR